MAARPKSIDGLNAAGELVNKAVTRLSDVVAKAEAVITSNPKLNAAEVSHYKDCIRTAKKQITVLAKLDRIPTPAPLDVTDAEPVKSRGRPPKAKEPTPIIAEPPKKRGRPPRAKVVVSEEAPRKRGRPKGSKNKPKMLNGVSAEAA